MKPDELRERLERMDKAATKGPWFMCEGQLSHFNDEYKFNTELFCVHEGYGGGNVPSAEFIVELVSAWRNGDLVVRDK